MKILRNILRNVLRNIHRTIPTSATFVETTILSSPFLATSKTCFCSFGDRLPCLPIINGEDEDEDDDDVDVDEDKEEE